MTKLSTILEWATNKEDLQDKTVLNSNPSDGEIKAFNEVCNKVMRLLKNSKIVSKDHLHTEDTSNSLFSTSMIRKSTLTQHLGEYDGDDFPGFMKKLAETFQKAKFKVRKGYGIDEIKGYEVINKDNEIIGEIDFLEKGSVPKLGNLVIFKHKKL